MISYNPVGYRPTAPRNFQMAAPRPQMGNLASMNIWDWVLLGGGIVVGGAGINGLISQAKAPRMNAISVLLNIVLTGVGLTLFIREGSKAISA